MAPIKFEENIKDTLEVRTIAPSESSWDKLSQRLDDKKSHKKPANFWWLGIAAGIVILIAAGIFFYDKEITPNYEQEIVETDFTIGDENEIINQIEKTGSDQSVPEVIKVAEIDAKVAEPSPADVPLSSKSKISLQEKAINSKVAATDKEINLLPKLISEGSIEEMKIAEVVAEIIKMKEKDQKVSDMEIDSLLKAAQREIFTSKIDNNKTRTVNADALLQDVEADLDKSFRYKVFDALKNGYESVKTAVAERNN